MRPVRTARALLVALAPLSAVAVLSSHTDALDWSAAGAGVAALALLAAAALAERRRGTAFAVAVIALLVALFGALVAPGSFERPMRALLLAGGALMLLSRLDVLLRGPAPTGLPSAAAQTVGHSAAPALLGVVLAAQTPGGDSASLVTTVVALLGALLACLDGARTTRGAARGSLVGATVVAAIGGARDLAAGRGQAALQLAALPVTLSWLLARRHAIRSDETPTIGELSTWQRLLLDPARMVAVTFAMLCAGGALLLWLPALGPPGQRLPAIDAAFTAVSATCVTGLAVVDTPSLSGLGQLALLLMIQVGGLGIMVFSTMALRLLGRRLSLRHEAAVAELVAQDDRGHLFDVLRRTLSVTFAVELGGALLLFAAFASGDDSLGQAAWRALFTAVSAFCNAGFALQSDSLVGYASQPFVLHTVALLIIAGGLSPPVVAALPTIVRRGPRALPLRPKVVLSVSGALLLVGFIAFIVLEWNSALATLSPLDRLHNAWFQSVTLRTAGFNSIDLARTTVPTQSLMNTLMFIGGSPGSTAGGVKTTTVFLVALAVLAGLRGRATIQVFGRTIPQLNLYRALAITVLALGVVGVAVTALHLTQTMPPTVALFEGVSAVGTVGLSLGGTALLDAVGKIIVIICMFVGRIGPLSTFLVLARRQRDVDWGRPDEEIQVG